VTPNQTHFIDNHLLFIFFCIKLAAERPFPLAHHHISKPAFKLDPLCSSAARSAVPSLPRLAQLNCISLGTGVNEAGGEHKCGLAK